MITYIGACDSTKSDERSGMLARKPNTTTWQTLTHNLDILRSSLHTNREIRVTTITRKLVSQPVGSKEANWLAICVVLGVAWKQRVVRLKRGNEVLRLLQLGELGKIGGELE